MAKEKKGIVKDFKDFITKGNIIDMAVGVIIGGAFGKIVSSLVADIITPLISLILGKANFSEMFVVLNNPDKQTFNTIAEAKEAGFATLNYGAFIQTIIDFLIIALCIFLILRAIVKAKAAAEKARKKDEEEAPAPEPAPEPEPSEEVLLLREIRDSLKKE